MRNKKNMSLSVVRTSVLTEKKTSLGTSSEVPTKCQEITPDITEKMKMRNKKNMSLSAVRTSVLTEKKTLSRTSSEVLINCQEKTPDVTEKMIMRNEKNIMETKQSHQCLSAVRTSVLTEKKTSLGTSSEVPTKCQEITPDITEKMKMRNEKNIMKTKQSIQLKGETYENQSATTVAVQLHSNKKFQTKNGSFFEQERSNY
jgi:hypothetical protein